jgi:hypothetical protein
MCPQRRYAASMVYHEKNAERLAEFSLVIARRIFGLLVGGFRGLGVGAGSSRFSSSSSSGMSWRYPEPTQGSEGNDLDKVGRRGVTSVQVVSGPGVDLGERCGGIESGRKTLRMAAGGDDTTAGVVGASLRRAKTKGPPSLSFALLCIMSGANGGGDSAWDDEGMDDELDGVDVSIDEEDIGVNPKGMVASNNDVFRSVCAPRPWRMSCSFESRLVHTARR